MTGILSKYIYSLQFRYQLPSGRTRKGRYPVALYADTDEEAEEELITYLKRSNRLLAYITKWEKTEQQFQDSSH